MTAAELAAAAVATLAVVAAAGVAALGVVAGRLRHRDADRWRAQRRAAARAGLPARRPQDDLEGWR